MILIDIIAVLIIVGGVIAAFLPVFISSTSGSVLPGMPNVAQSGFLASGRGLTATGIVFFTIGAVIIFLAATIQAGGFPLIVKSAVKGNVEILAAIKGALSRIGGIVLYTVIFLLIMAPFIVGIILLVVGSAMTLSTVFMGTVSSTAMAMIGIGGILMLVGFIIAVVFGVKLWLTMSILMIEKKGAVESMKVSWNMTKGKMLSIIGATFLFLLIIALPLVIVDAAIKFVTTPLPGATSVGYSFSVVYAVWYVIYSVILGTLGGVFPTIYYYNLKKK
jgi:hypothetical protein